MIEITPMNEGTVMHKRNMQVTIWLGVWACFILSGCYQGYGQTVNSQTELDTLLSSLTPSTDSPPVPAPTQQPLMPTSAPTSIQTNEAFMVDGVLVYVVVQGDTLPDVARRYNVDLDVLALWNNITDVTSLLPDQILIIPPTHTPALQGGEPTASPATMTLTATAIPSPTPLARTDDNPVMHRVEVGQTLFQIAQTYGVTVDALAAANGISDTNQLIAGQDLIIPSVGIDDGASLPQPQITSEAGNTELVHVVTNGETLYQISLQYGVSLESLARINQIPDTNQVVAGQELRIPEATPSAIVMGENLSTDDTIPQRIAYNAPTQVNGVPLSQIVVISPEAEAKIQSIYARGQTMGRNPRAFSKLGDSTIENPHFLARFDNQQNFDYNLGEYAYLEAVISYYAGSFARQGEAVRRGMHAWTVFDPQWANNTNCRAGESPLACEFRIHNPSILLVRLGANDVGVPQAFESNMRDVIEFAIENGVIPIIGTKSDRNDGADNPNNRIIRRLVAEYQLPLWDFDHLADTLPRRGLTTDGIHMTTNFSHDYTVPATLQTGHGANNLSALILLDTLWQTLGYDAG